MNMMTWLRNKATMGTMSVGTPEENGAADASKLGHGRGGSARGQGPLTFLFKFQYIHKTATFDFYAQRGNPCGWHFSADLLSRGPFAIVFQHCCRTGSIESIRSAVGLPPPPFFCFSFKKSQNFLNSCGNRAWASQNHLVPHRCCAFCARPRERLGVWRPLDFQCAHLISHAITQRHFSSRQIPEFFNTERKFRRLKQ